MIDVLLATYRPNAEWLKAQVDSIRAQIGVEVNLICREDEDKLGARHNFSKLLSVSQADYIAFSDQDDVWAENKLSLSLGALQELESRYGPDTPLLVFCDGYVTDDRLNRCGGTVISRQKVDVAKGLSFNRLLMQNFIPGNSMLFNAALRSKAGAVPEGAIMHDVWLALVAAAFGIIGCVDEPLYCYRQHSANVVGSTCSGGRHLCLRAMEGVGAFRSRLQSNIEQARAFVDRYGASAPSSAQALAQFGECGFWNRRKHLLKHRLFKHGVSRNLSLLAFA